MTLAPLKLPPIAEETLPNGLTVITVSKSDLPMIAMRLVLRTGAGSDPKGKYGVAALTGSLLRRGTKKRTGEQVDEAIESTGGLLGSDVGYEATTVAATVPSDRAAGALETIADVVCNPAFPLKSFEMEKRRELAQIRSGLDEPSIIADRALISFFYGKDHPFSRPIEGVTATVKNIKRGDLAAFHGKNFTPSGAMLFMAGDINLPEAVKLARKAFGRWKGDDFKQLDVTQPATPTGVQILLVDKPDATQAQVRFAVPGINRRDPAFHAAVIANTVVGGGFTSRLVDEVRVNRGLSYSVSTRLMALRQVGAVLYSTFTRNETIREIIDVSFAALQKFHDSGPTEDEVAKAKRYINGLYPSRVESVEQLADGLAAARMNDLPFDSISEYRERVESVTVADAAAAARIFPTQAGVKIVVVGSAKAIRGQLEGLGKVTVAKVKSFE